MPASEQFGYLAMYYKVCGSSRFVPHPLEVYCALEHAGLIA